ncbi:MAG TPA: alcohol dehydrogenase catalytic domain-containing protein [Thermoanaerobaculia bacterium]|nr:alcohol dehydrogenase catalytic domain-containing protein [Thermoanaerobaculia bacterium]
MKGVRVAEDGSVSVVELPVPRIGPGDALMRTRASGICGSDLLSWYVRRKAGTVLGHEVAGEIVAVGEAVEAFAPGDRVVPHHHAACGECAACRSGRAVQCRQWRASALDPGGMAEWVRIPSENLRRDTLKAPPAISDEEATFVEPLATVVKAFRRGGFTGSRSVLAVGLGTTGQLAIRLAKSQGASRIAGADRAASRLAVAEASGASEIFDVSRRPLDETTGEPFDFVFVGPGKARVIDSALSRVAPGGTLLAFTMASPEERLTVSPHDLYFREVEIVPSYSAGPDDMREALSLLAARRLPVADLVTHRFPIGEARDAFARAVDPEGSLKVLLTFDS